MKGQVWISVSLESILLSTSSWPGSCGLVFIWMTRASVTRSHTAEGKTGYDEVSEDG